MLVHAARTNLCQRLFSTCATLHANRAIVYSQNGEPQSVLRALTFPTLSPPPPNALNIRFLLSPVNPSDVNVIQGVYPAKPAPSTLLASAVDDKNEPLFVGGNEAVAEVTQLGEGVEGLKKGDWVIMAKQQAGTWASQATVKLEDVIQVEQGMEGFRLEHAATLTVSTSYSAHCADRLIRSHLQVNPPTAWNMLRDFVHLKEGDWVLQNGANSAVCFHQIHPSSSQLKFM
jgi:trans-2-enoyl-CoA reductase